jgi:hypothetical protein
VGAGMVVGEVEARLDIFSPVQMSLRGCSCSTLAPHCVPWHRPPGQVCCSAGEQSPIKRKRLLDGILSVAVNKNRPVSSTFSAGWFPDSKGSISITIFMSLTILAMGECRSFINKNSDLEHPYEQHVIDITYCDVNLPSKICVASFGNENENKTLVNLITADPSSPDFNIKIQRNGNQRVYECHRLRIFPPVSIVLGKNFPWKNNGVGDLFKS